MELPRERDIREGCTYLGDVTLQHGTESLCQKTPKEKSAHLNYFLNNWMGKILCFVLADI